MKKANAELSYIVEASCPHCGNLKDLIPLSDPDDLIINSIMDDEFYDLGIVVECQDCQEKFELNDIDR